MPRIASTGQKDPSLRCDILPDEVDEAGRAFPANYTTIASGKLYRNKPDEAIKILTKPPLSMPLDLAKLLIQAAIGLKKGVSVDFETTFKDPIRMAGERTYSNFRRGKE